jgi:hypothetical protein
MRPSALSVVRGVGHVAGDPVEPLSNVRGVDRESRNIDRPPGVASCFQISSNSVEPSVPSLSRNLFSHDDRGAAGGDEAVEVGPEVSGVVNSGAFACDRERLAGATARPHRSVVGPPGKAEGVGPAADPGEEVALGKASEFIRGNIDN